MHCRACRRTMVSTSSQELRDEKGTMTITRWRCRPCHETAEEIRLGDGYQGPSPSCIRYTVTGSEKRRKPARSFGGSRGGSVSHAVAG